MEQLEPLGWGIVGPGQIARVFADSITESGVGRVVGVVGRDRGRAKQFADRYGARTHTCWLEVLLDQADVDAVYIATPHSAHDRALIRATMPRCDPRDDGTVVERRIPVLCEKPLTPRAFVTETAIRQAREFGTPLAEGWMYRTHPQIARAVERLRAGDIGRCLRVESCFGFAAPYDRSHRLFAPELGGGSILDVGGYPLGLALLAADGSEIDQDRWNVEPRSPRAQAAALFDEVRCVWAPGDERPRGPSSRTNDRVDLEAFARFHLGELEVVAEVSMVRELGRSGRFVGETGTLELTDPFLPGGERRGLVGEIVHTDARGRRDVETVASEHDCFALEALAMRDMIREGRIEPRWPMVDHAESIRIARLMEAWRSALGAFE